MLTDADCQDCPHFQGEGKDCVVCVQNAALPLKPMRVEALSSSNESPPTREETISHS